MKPISILSRLCVLILALAVSACHYASATIESQRLSQAPVTPQRLLVFADVGTVLDGLLHDESVFSADLTNSLNKCGVPTAYLKKREINKQLTLDDSANKNDDRGLSTSTFGADTILDIQWTQQRIPGPGSTGQRSADYAVVLVNQKSRAVLWKGQLSLVAARFAGQRFAVTLIDRLKQDGFIPASCMALDAP